MRLRMRIQGYSYSAPTCTTYWTSPTNIGRHLPALESPLYFEKRDRSDPRRLKTVRTPPALVLSPNTSPPGAPRSKSGPTSMASALDTFMSYLRLPLLASSGVAALLSGLLYFKQKHASPMSPQGLLLTAAVKSYIRELSLPTPVQMCHGRRNSASPTSKNSSFLHLMASLLAPSSSGQTSNTRAM